MDQFMTELIERTAKQYGLDASRMVGAETILRHLPHSIQLAKRDENHMAIVQSADVLCVESTRAGNWYVVRKGKCTCQDSRLGGNVCKHRIAVHIWQAYQVEMLIRAQIDSREIARRYLREGEAGAAMFSDVEVIMAQGRTAVRLAQEAK